MTDGKCKIGAIQSVKMKLIDSFFLHHPHLLDGNICCN